jgi:hypothetical protein
MLDQQMELGLNRSTECPSVYRRQRRHNRARWWFAQMRRAVDRALDWPAAPLPRPEQMWMPYRQVVAVCGSATEPAREEQQMSA